MDVDVVETISEGWLERRYPGRVEAPSEEDGRKKSGPTDPAQILYTSGGLKIADDESVRVLIQDA